MSEKKIVACAKCGVAFPEWDAELAHELDMKCPYCKGKLQLHTVVEP